MIIRSFERCPRCGKPLKPAIAIDGGESKSWLECSSPLCNTFVNTYFPQEHQRSVHEDNHRFIGNFGGYGTGKTTTSREEFYKHILLTPFGNTLIGANVASQYEQTLKRDIENDLPVAFVKTYSQQKQYFELYNSHRVIYRPFDDPGKLRSYNLSMFIILEASEVKPESFTQLKTRLRNMAASTPELDESDNIVYTYENGIAIPKVKQNWCKGIIESNPDSGWIRSEVLNVSDEVFKHGTVFDYFESDEDTKDPLISSHVASSDVNVFLPKDFKEQTCKNKPAWWVNRYFYGSFLYAEGMVYPSSQKYVCEDFPIPRHWKRIVAADYGLKDNFVYLFGAISPEDNLLFIYKEVVVNNKNLEELAKMFFKNAEDVPIGGWVCPPILDPKSAPKRDYDKVSLADKFLEFGIAFKPGQISKDARIFATNTYFESGKVRMFRHACPVLIRELREYKFKAAPNAEQGFLDKPEDKNDHCISCLEWIVMELPRDPSELVYGVYNKQGVEISMNRPKIQNDLDMYAKHIFSDDTENTSNEPFEMTNYFNW